MTISALQTSAVRTRQAYVMVDLVDLYNAIERAGFEVIRQDNKGLEQGYYWPTIVKGTAFHGQQRRDFVSTENDRFGVVVTGSHDCQLAVEIYAGIRAGDHVLPMVRISYIKHNQASVSQFNAADLAEKLRGGINQVMELVESWAKETVSFGYCMKVWGSVNEKRAELFPKTSDLSPEISGNKLGLFSNLILDCLYGQGFYTNGKQVKAIKHLRRHLQLVPFITSLLA